MWAQHHRRHITEIFRNLLIVRHRNYRIHIKNDNYFWIWANHMPYVQLQSSGLRHEDRKQPQSTRASLIPMKILLLENIKRPGTCNLWLHETGHRFFYFVCASGVGGYSWNEISNPDLLYTCNMYSEHSSVLSMCDRKASLT